LVKAALEKIQIISVREVGKIKGNSKAQQKVKAAYI